MAAFVQLGKCLKTSVNFSTENVQCHYSKDWGHMKWDCPNRSKSSPRPPVCVQMGTFDQICDEITNTEDTILIQRLERLGFSRAGMIAQP